MALFVPPGREYVGDNGGKRVEDAMTKAGLGNKTILILLGHGRIDESGSRSYFRGRDVVAGVTRCCWQ
jgi:hypothetical protein